MRFVIVFFAVFLSGCATAPPKSVQNSKILFQTEEQWSACTAKVIEDLQEKGKKEYGDSSSYVGAGGRTAYLDAIDQCGKKPETGVLTAEQKEIIKFECQNQNSLDFSSEASKSHFFGYSDNSKTLELASDLCAATYTQARIDARNDSLKKMQEEREALHKSRVQLTAAQMQVIQESVGALLKDPYSARYSSMIAARAGALIYVCGQVNAKNSFGGYTGNESFAGVLIRNNFIVSFVGSQLVDKRISVPCWDII